MINPFESFEDIATDPYFRQCVIDQIEQIKTSRAIRPMPKPGYRYIRDWYDRMSEKDQITAQFFLDHIVLIWQKRSNLDAETRKVIKHFCDKACMSALIEHDKLETTKLAEAEKPDCL